MRRLFAWCAATSVLCLGLAGVGASTAGAARTAHAAKFVGTYTATVTFTEGPMLTESWTVSPNGAFSNNSVGTSGQWSNTKSQIVLSDVEGSYEFTYSGQKTPKGLGNRRNQGAFYVNGNPVGSWYAIKTG